MLNPQMVEQISKTAVQTALEYLNKERLQQQKVKRDRRLRNTKLLLKNYRAFEEHSYKLEDKLSVVQEAETLNELYGEDFAVESIKKSEKRTIVMVRFIRRSLESYRIMCETSGQFEDVRRYKIIETMYVSKAILTPEQVAECHKIDVRTVYRDINNACNTLSVLIFGVDAIQFD